MSPRRHDPAEWGQWPVPEPPQGIGWSFLRRRAEMGAALALGGPPTALYFLTGSLGDVVALIAAGVATLAVPGVQDLLADQFRRLVVERRLRTAFVEIPICSRSGTVPTILRSVARTTGTIVHVWCPAGVTVARIAEDHAALAEACFVDEVVVEPHQRWSNIAVIVVLRPALGRRRPLF